MVYYFVVFTCNVVCLCVTPVAHLVVGSDPLQIRSIVVPTLYMGQTASRHYTILNYSNGYLYAY